MSEGTYSGVIFHIVFLPAGGATVVVLCVERVVGTTKVCDGLLTGGFQTTIKKQENPIYADLYG